MRILFASMPADGHFRPLTGIAAHLAGAGHDVRWYAGPEYGSKLDDLGMAWFPYRRATEITGENINGLFPERTRLRGPQLISFDLEKFFVSNVDHHFRDIADIRADFSFDAVVCDGAFYAETLLAEVLDIPVFAVTITPVLPTGDSPPPFFGLRPARTVVDRAVHGVVRRMLASTMKPGTRAFNHILAGHGIAPIPEDGFPHVPLAAVDRIFLNGSPGLEFPGYRPPANAEYVGPIVPARSLRGSPATLPIAVLDPDATVIAVSQGTVDRTDPTKLIVPTLEALAEGPYVVVATTAGTQTAQLRERFGSATVVVEDFLDYDLLFPHVDVFVTNGGFNSMLAAVRHGVPLVAAGKTEGKNDIAARIGHNRLGVDLRTERPGPDRIRRAVRRLLDDPGIRTTVRRIQAELGAYDPGARIEAALTSACPSGIPRTPPAAGGSS